jgi:DNA modification methylase
MKRGSRLVKKKSVKRTRKIKIFNGDNRKILKKIPDNSVDSIVTDPPYALVSIVKRFGKKGSAPAKVNQAYVRASRGFMGQTWDTAEVTNDPAFWKECLRVLKPGGHLLSFGGTRTYHRMVCAIEDAGFEIRDMIQWLYGSGFPKSHDVSKKINKAVKAKWDGWGTALKPANEPIVLARKPLSERTVAANVLKWGAGAINIDRCRVEGGKRSPGFSDSLGEVERSGSLSGKKTPRANIDETQGRFPANVITDGSDEVVAMFPNSSARFFYHPKANKKDRAGSKHPTIKPINLLRYLIRLVTPKNGLVLDPFAGSGTTAEAADMEGCEVILIEKEKKYQNDIRRRLQKIRTRKSRLKTKTRKK